MYEHLFEELGLTNSESDAYLALLDLGDTTRGDLVHKTGISLSKIYDVLERLQQKGLATIYLKDNIKHFKAQHPKQLLNYLEDKKQTLDKQQEAVNKALPKLTQQFLKETTEHEVELLSGLKSLQLYFQQQIEELQKGETNYVIGGTKGSDDEHVVAFFRKVHRLREEKGIKTKMLYNVRQKATVQESYSKEEFSHSQARFIAHTSAVSINIHANKVLIIVFAKDLTGVKITSQDVADSFIEYFKLLWKLSE